MQIRTFNFSKCKNSTKIPDTEGQLFNIVLKENTSVDEPTFILNHSEVPSFNYCQWMFSYYFVEDIILQTKDIYEIRCKLDSLATYRNEILNSTQYILRSASDYNIFLPDAEMTPALNQTKVTWRTPINELGGGTYIVRVLGYVNAASKKGIPTYAMNEDELNQLIYKCFDQQIYSTQIQSISDVGELFKCALFRPSENILTVNWIPYTLDISSKIRVYVGKYDTKIDAHYLAVDGERIYKSITAVTPYYNDFRDFDDRFTKFQLSIPAVGIVPINPADAYAGIDATILLDVRTGDLIYHLYNTQTLAKIGKYKTNVNATVNIGGDTGQSFADSIQSSISAIGTLAMDSPNKNYGGLSTGLNAIGKITQNVLQPTFTSIGSVSSEIDIRTDHDFHLIRTRFGTGDYATARAGRPLNENRTLNTLSGYCQCENAKLDSVAFGVIKDEIVEMLNNGFYIE